MTRVLADNAVFKATGSYRGSTAGDFKAAGCPLVKAGKMNAKEANGWLWYARCCRPQGVIRRRRGCCVRRHVRG